EERVSEPNWSERVEDLVAAGDVTAAISFLESLETNLQSRLGSSSSGERTKFGLQLAATLTQLADLYSPQGLSLKSDELRTRSSLIKQRALDCDRASSRDSGDVENQSIASNGLKSDTNVSPANDWEGLAEVAECEETSYFKMRQLKVKRWQSFGKFSRVKVMDMMLERLQGLQEDQLSSLASVVATCSLNEVLAEVGNHQRLHTTNIEPTVSEHGSYSSMDKRLRLPSQ
ncbi:unnamed protein product, partial [Arabidopsis halleri]